MLTAEAFTWPGGRNYKVHLDGYNLLPVLQGRQEQWPREEFLYWTDNGQVAALRSKKTGK